MSLLELSQQSSLELMHLPTADEKAQAGALGKDSQLKDLQLDEVWKALGHCSSTGDVVQLPRGT